ELRRRAAVDLVKRAVDQRPRLFGAKGPYSKALGTSARVGTTQRSSRFGRSDPRSRRGLVSEVPAQELSSVGAIFVGRDREMGELRRLAEDAFQGSGRLVLVSGEPGIGKTRTAHELARRAR